MSGSSLSFGNTASFRNQLLAKNLTPYNVPGSFTSPGNSFDYETTISVSNVVDSPNNLVSTNYFAETLYPLNEYGPEGGFGNPININGVLSGNNPEGSNQGPYQPIETSLDIVNEFFIDSAYVTNKWGPSGGFKDMVIITDILGGGNIYQPYWNPGYFNYSLYSPFSILFQNDPVGSNGPLSQDSFLAQIGASQLKFAFEERIAQELEQATVGAFNLDSLTDPFTASLIATGQQPFFVRDWRITVPENPLLGAVSLGNRLTGTYFPVSFIPGDYFNEVSPYNNPNQTSLALNTINNLTGGLLSPILNKTRNPSEIFVANTGNGTRSVLFASLNYNLYRPSYNIGLTQGILSLFGQSSTGLYYVGDRNSEPSLISSPPNQVPVNQFGQQQASIVYGPQELSKLYEGNDDQINFGLKGKSYTDGGGITGQLVWTSPKYKPNAGFNATVGGGVGSIDDEFNQISADYLTYESTNIDFKPGSILYNTQRLVESADQVQGQARLKHVGTAMNQVSKVFNDGYKEITKGSQVLSYVDQADGTQAGLEYCRIFTKDTPYYTYADLQKTDGITKSGRRVDYSILDNTYNLNIAPIRNPNSTNIVDGKVKKYMFSLENLAWRTSDRPGFTYDDLPACERGPNGGRIMWFPPYDIKFNEDSRPDFNTTSFLGRPEPIYTYKNTSRTGTLSWTIIVDNPSMLNTIIEKQMKGIAKERVQSIVDSFFAGCVKYDLYELATKFNMLSPNELFTYQELLNNPRLTAEEQIEILQSIPQDVELNSPGKSTEPDGTENVTSTGNIEESNIEYNTVELNQYQGYGFYFENDIPKGNPGSVASDSFDVYYNQYIPLQNTTYSQKAPKIVSSDNEVFSGSGIPNFFSNVINGNFNIIQNELIKKIDSILIDGGKVTIDLIGSASAPANESYNKKLSERRNDSVKKWFLKQILSNGETIQSYSDSGKFVVNLTSFGEETVIPKTKIESQGDNGNVSIFNSTGGEVLTSSVNCTKDIINLDVNPNKVNTQSQWYSIPAMACRRVAIKKIVVEEKVTPPPPIVVNNDQVADIESVSTPLVQTTQSIKPQPNVTIEQKIKEGISKKILRNLFTECDYFQLIEENSPMVYETIKDKIKYFSPAFHSMTPEGLNSRLTFLQQCVRPGQSIPIIGTDGRPKYNDALNTSFGTPPILVLRIGDFFNTKIVPTSLGITYDPLLFDMNPEGIGVQPMLAKISMAFNIIGGMGIKEPVQQLQNALSFNYYANTEIYDERSVATESTEEKDKYVVEKIMSSLPTVSLDEQNVVNNIQPKKGQSLIGNVISDTEIDYSTILGDLEVGIRSYYNTYFDSIEKITEDYNYGITQLYLKNRSYTKGKLSEFTNDGVNIELFGKNNNDQDYVEKLIKNVKNDIDDGNSPIIINLIDFMTNKEKRELKDRMKNLVNERQGEILDVLNNGVSNLINNQTDLNFIFRKLDVITNKLDGRIDDKNEPIINDLSGNEFFASKDTDGSILNIYTKLLPESIKKFNTFLKDKELVTNSYNINKSTLENNSNSCSFGPIIDSCPLNRFYIAMSKILTDPQKINSTISYLTSGPEISKNNNLVNQISDKCLFFGEEFKEYDEFFIKKFKQSKESEEFKDIINFTLPINKITKCNYTSNVTNNTNDKKKIIKNLYSNVNLNNKKDTFNGKVTFN